MEEDIQDIKRNLNELKKDLQVVADKNNKGIPIDPELFLINERIWNIEQYISDLETFI